MKTGKLTIVATGLIAQHYSLAGVTWDYIQYIIGLRKLGHDVYYLEDSGEWPYNLDGGESGVDWVAKDCAKNVQYLDYIFKKFELGPVWGYRFPITDTWYGLSDKKRKEIINNADLLINISGTLEKPDRFPAKRKVYIDSDPGFTQVKLLSGEKEFAYRLSAHDAHFSFGERINEAFPNTGYYWKPTRSPIVVDLWDGDEKAGNMYTTIMNWTSYKPLHFNGTIYGQKDMEFIKYLDLAVYKPDINFQIALSETEHKNWQSTISREQLVSSHNNTLTDFDSPASLLQHYGWNILRPSNCCGTVDDYRSFIRNSRAEWSVAKSGYVVSKSGWFSCRSSCYLCSGRPVVVQDTGLGGLFPLGEGLFAFQNIEESIHAIEAIESNYNYHASRAKELACSYFNSDKILSDLIEKSFE